MNRLTYLPSKFCSHSATIPKKKRKFESFTDHQFLFMIQGSICHDVMRKCFIYSHSYIELEKEKEKDVL